MRRALWWPVAALVSVASPCDAQQLTADAAVNTLGAYLLDYETRVTDLAVDEQYEQWLKRKPGYGQEVVTRRKFKSTFLLVQLPDGQSWLGLRDVFTVDGKAIRATDSPKMEEVLGGRDPEAVSEALRLMRENAKYNIGPVYRTINLPLQALALLHPRNRSRFEFTLAGPGRAAGRSAIQIDFDERGRPTIITDGFGGDRPSQGRVWVDPSTGAVLRTELRIGDPALTSEAVVRVDYRWDGRLRAFLPSELEETYPLDIEVLHGRASYRNYRQFQTGARLVVPAN